MTLIHPVILCGGSGTRLWPSSRKAFPKQFSSLVGDHSLYQQTLKRLSGKLFDKPIVLTHTDFRFVAREQAEAIGLMDAAIVLEPIARDTAPAILTAALMKKDSPDDLMLIAPSDHLIERPDEFIAAVETGITAANAGNLVTFGITPKSPETGYGYLELPAAPTPGQASKLVRFVEKPDADTASEMLKSGRHLWNGGIFLFRVGDILAAFHEHAADMVGPCQDALDNCGQDLGFLRLDEAAYGSVRAQSIDYAVMEKSQAISVVPISAGWSDLGSWASLHAALVTSGDGVLTEGDVTAIDCENSVLRSEDPNVHLVGLGVKDIVAVATRDAVLVADINKSQQVKQVVEVLRAKQAPQADDHPQFHRPWGWYETLCISDRFQVKRIMVRPGGILSLQSHVHRSEHWVVVAGTAKVTVGDKVQLLGENQSVYIPLGAVHRMENPGKLPMYLIEVQTGGYLGEDDIERYEDVYDRS
ncbi:MAG: mannose-1-phosphate guanylyltransferase/mannose-6-phosphate isomerase [Paracoccaceae bacterium]